MACDAGDGGYSCGGGGEEEGEEAVIEVGEEEDFTIGEGGEEGGLVDAVEGAWFEFAYSVYAYVLVGRFGKKEQGQRRREGGEKGRQKGEKKKSRRDKRIREGGERVKGRRRNKCTHPLMALIQQTCWSVESHKFDGTSTTHHHVPECVMCHCFDILQQVSGSHKSTSFHKDCKLVSGLHR